MTQEQRAPEMVGETTSMPSKLKRAWIWSFAILLVVVVLLVLVKSIYTNLRERGWTTYTSRNSGLVRGLVSALSIDERGRVWVGTSGGDLSVLAPDGSWTTYTSEDSSLVGDHVNALAIDEDGSVWVGTSSGLSVLASNLSLTTYTREDSGLAGNDVQTLAIDEGDRVWVGTTDGLSVLAPEGSWTTYTSRDSRVLRDAVNAMAIDEKGRVWVGTSGGLSVLSLDGVTDPRPGTALGTPVSAAGVPENQCLALTTADGGADLSSSLVSWWPGDGDATDIIGANDGALVDRATFATGFVEQAFSFSNGALGLAVQPPLAQGFTIDAWVNFEGTNFDNFVHQEIFNNNQVFLRKNGIEEGNKLAVFVKLADGSVEPRAQSTTIPLAGTWTHVAATWDGTTLKLYVNGQLEGTSTRPGPLTTTTVQAQIGRGQQTNLLGFSFFGRIDEVDIFNRALLAAEIRAIFAAGSAGKCLPDAPDADGGGSWTTYTSEDSGLVDDRVSALAIDKGGRVWVGASNVLSVLAPDESWTTYILPIPEFIANPIRSLAFDEAGRVWLGTHCCGLSVIARDGSWTNYTREDSGLESDNVNFVAIAETGRVWVGTDRSLSEFEEGASTSKIILSTFSDGVSVLRFARNLAVFSLAILSIGVVIRRKPKPIETPATKPTPRAEARAPQKRPVAPSVPAAGILSDPRIALAEGRTLLSQGKRDEAVAQLMHAFREGSPEIRREAINELEELGEMKAF